MLTCNLEEAGFQLVRVKTFRRNSFLTSRDRREKKGKKRKGSNEDRARHTEARTPKDLLT